MELCNKRKSCIAKGICAINITPDTYNCKQFHRALEEKFTPTNTARDASFRDSSGQLFVKNEVGKRKYCPVFEAKSENQHP